MRKQIAMIAVVVAAVAPVSAQTKKPVAKPSATPAAKKAVPAAPVLKNATDSFSYAAGMSIALSMKQQGVTDINAAIMQKAIDDNLQSKPTLMSEEQANLTLQQKLQQFAMKKIEVEKEKGMAFCSQNKTRPGVTVLPNGLQYEVVKAGDPNGIKPAAADTVVVDYKGTLLDGTKFDASYDRGEPATFCLNQVIRGWTEILQEMTPGAKWKVTIPSDLAYGDRGAGAIPPGATLQFDIELHEVKPAAK